MVLVYSQTDSPRLRYASKVIFEDILGVEVQITDNLEDFISSDTIKINYSETALEDSIQIFPSEIIFENDIQNQTITVHDWNGIPVLFYKEDGSPFPFDPIAMTFYLVSRYEEYIPGERDRHGRFIPEYSLAGQHGFLDKPLLNIIALKIRDHLSLHYPGQNFPQPEYKFTPTVDIDQAFAHAGKGFFRTLGGLTKLMFRLKIKDSLEKLKVVFGTQADPFDNFEFQLEIFRQNQLNPIYFVLLGDYGTYDKNSSHNNTRFKRLIKDLSGKAEIGIHPSYGSSENPDKLAVEVRRLDKITGKPVHCSRQHFLRMPLPGTYHQLQDLEINNDYSMGYASALGFRASICNSYNAFDLVQNRELPVRIHPFAFMDSALSDYIKVLPQEYIKFVRPLISSVKQVGGNLIGIWHNYALSDDKARHDAFKEIIKEAINDQAPQA